MSWQCDYCGHIKEVQKEIFYKCEKCCAGIMRCVEPEYKTLMELWKEHGEKPIDVRRNDGTCYHIAAVTPDKSFLMWDLRTGMGTVWTLTKAEWEICIPPKQKWYRVKTFFRVNPDNTISVYEQLLHFSYFKTKDAALKTLNCEFDAVLVWDEIEL